MQTEQSRRINIEVTVGERAENVARRCKCSMASFSLARVLYELSVDQGLIESRSTPALPRARLMRDHCQMPPIETGSTAIAPVLRTELIAHCTQTP